MTYTVRIAEKSDAEAVHDIYGYYVENTTITFSTVNPSVSDYAQKIEKTESMSSTTLLVAMLRSDFSTELTRAVGPTRSAP